jgi:hypothetical protein
LNTENGQGSHKGIMAQVGAFKHRMFVYTHTLGPHLPYHTIC